jgi:CheY-like chemotaxis protein
MMKFGQDYEPEFSGFHDLMKYRVREILLVSSFYDAFVLEEDGRLSERIISDYLDLNLRFIPRIKRVSSAEKALGLLRTHPFDLVITMTRIKDMDPIEFGRKVKEMNAFKPVVLLTFERLDPDRVQALQGEPAIDKVFFWTGDTKIFLALIKWVEDFRNVAHDVRQGVQVVLAVEDSPRYYSSFLPLIYTEIMTQTRALISESVNDLHRLLRMRARPKILMAETYEEAMEIFDLYKHNLLGIISDIRYSRNGEMDPEAGFRLVDEVKSRVGDLPILLQSSEEGNRSLAREKGVAFLNKESPTLLLELRAFVLQNFGFGDFVFRRPDRTEVGRARNPREFLKRLATVPIESIVYHAAGNHISRWLRARTEFEVADEVRPKQVSDFPDAEGIRRYLISVVHRLIDRQQVGVIQDFEPALQHLHHSFIRLGSGSLGGKGRGLAFLNALLAKSGLASGFSEAVIRTPKSFVVCTDVFEEFIKTNDLQMFAINAQSDEDVTARFLACPLPPAIVRDLDSLLKKVKFPLAVRSSSLLEDSQMLPFAGLYSTYLLANHHRSRRRRLRQLTDAVKLVYASVFYNAPKEYVYNTNYRIEEEKMAVVVQELAGQNHSGAFYPAVSGVAQSYNFYPFSHLRPVEGIVSLALGLGKTIVEGGRIYRFSPAYPEMNPPFGSASEFVQQSQTAFYALDMGSTDTPLLRDDAVNLLRLDLPRAEKDGSLYYVASTYVAPDDAIRHTLAADGPRVVTFANLLRHRLFPLADLLKTVLNLGRQAFGTHIEIEFALDFPNGDDRLPEFHLLQIRPMIAGAERVDVEIGDVDPGLAVCRSANAMGNGAFDDIRDIVYVDPDTFDIAKTHRIAREVGELNRTFEDRPYVLIGFGRWGTSDPWLGIPVDWGQMSRARVIVEANRPNLNVEPSQGSHFFHNLVSLRMGYLHIRREDEENGVDWGWLQNQPTFQKTAHVRHVRFEKPLRIRIDGRCSRGVIFKPS